MSKRDVDLIIRAKNEASRALDAAAKSMQSLEDQQTSLGDSAKKTDNLLGQLTDEFSKLKAVSANIQAFNKIRDQAEKAGEAFAKQRQDLQRAQEELTQLSQAQNVLAATSAKLQQEVAESSAALKLQTQSLSAAKSEMLGYESASRKAAAAADRAEAALAKARQRYAEKPNVRNEVALVEAGRAVARARQEARQAEAAQAGLTRAYRDQVQAVQRNKEAHSNIVRALAEVKSAERSTAAEVTRTGAAITKQTANLDAAKQEYAELGQVVQRAEQTFNRAASAQSVVGQSAQAVGQQLTVLKARMLELQAAQRSSATSRPLIDPAALRESNLGLREAVTTIRAATNEAARGEVGLRELGQAVEQVSRSGQQLDGLLRSVQKQEKAVSDAREEWRSAQAEVKRLATALKQAENPSNALASAFGAAQGKARLAKDAFRQQEQAAAELGQGLRQAGLAHRDLGEAQTLLKARVASNNDVLLRGRAALIGYGDAASKGATGSRNAAAGIRQIKPAADPASASLRDLIRQLTGVESSGRKSLSLFQRFRGQLLSIAAASGGVFAVQNAIGGVVKAQLDMDAVTSRFAVAFEGDQAKVARAIEFTRATADDLGLSFRTLSLQYSRLAAASLGTSLEGEKTELIFRQISEAARVLRLSDDEVAGSFKALTDIMSKGTIQAEELKGQLGDRFPGAVQIMAKALGVTTEELADMMEQGQLTSEALSAFANEISQRVAPALDEARKSSAAAFESLKNSIFDIQLVIARSGFVDELAAGARDLATALQDPAVQEGFRALGEGLADFVRFSVAALPYMSEILTALQLLAGFLVTRFVGKAIVDTVAGLAKLRVAMALVQTNFKGLAAAAASSTGTMGKLIAVLNLAGLARLGLYGIIIAQIVHIGTAAYDAYQAVQNLNKQIAKNDREQAKAKEDLANKQKALADIQAQAQGDLIRAQEKAGLSAEDLQKKVKEIAESYKAVQLGQKGFIRSSAEVIKMTDKEIDAYQEVLIARMRVVGAARTNAMMHPDDPDSPRIIAQATIEMDNLARAVENSAKEEAGRKQALESTEGAVKDVAVAMEDAARKADLLNGRLEAVAELNFNNAIIGLERVRDARISALILSGADASKILAAETQFEQQRLSLIRRYSQQQLDLVAQDEQRRKAILDQSNLDADERAKASVKIEDEASKARVSIVQKEVQSISAARDQALSKYQAALGRIADLDRRIADIRLQGEFQVADIRRSTMTDYASFLSREAELAKLNGRIKDEIAKGNLEVAEALAQRQLSLAQSLNQEVKDGEQIVVSKEQAAQKAIAGTQRGNENLISVLQKRKEIEKAEAEQQKKLYENLTTALENLNKQLARMAGATDIDIPLTVDEQKAQNQVDQALAGMKAVALQSKVSMPITADTREYVAKFDSEVLSKDGSQVRVGVFLEDGAYKIKVNEIQNQKIVATAAVEFSGTQLDAAIARAKQIVEGDFPKMQLAFDSAQTMAEYQQLTEEVKRQLAADSFTVTAQFRADDADVAAVVEKYKTTVTPAPVEFQPDTRAADFARLQVGQAIIVPVTFAPTNSPTGRANGGPVQARANGGPIRGIEKFASGGLFSGAGTGTSDSNLVALSDKEFVIRSMAVRKYGQGTFQALNSGMINPDRLSQAIAGGTGDETTLNLSFNGNPIGRLSGSRNTVQNLVDALTELAHQTGGTL